MQINLLWLQWNWLETENIFFLNDDHSRLADIIEICHLPLCVQFIYFYLCCHKHLTGLVTHDRLLSVAQQGGCCLVTEPVLFVGSEVWGVHAAMLGLSPRSCVVQMNPPPVVIAVRDLIGRNKWEYISLHWQPEEYSEHIFCRLLLGQVDYSVFCWCLF